MPVLFTPEHPNIKITCQELNFQSFFSISAEINFVQWFVLVQDALKQLLTLQCWWKWWIFTSPLYKSPSFGEQLLIISKHTNSRAPTLTLTANSPPGTLSCSYLTHLFPSPAFGLSPTLLAQISFSGQYFTTTKLKNSSYYF